MSVSYLTELLLLGDDTDGRLNQRSEHKAIPNTLCLSFSQGTSCIHYQSCSAVAAGGSELGQMQISVVTPYVCLSIDHFVASIMYNVSDFC